MLQINLVFIILVLVIVPGLPTVTSEDVQIETFNFKSLNDQNEYQFDYKLSDGQVRSEQGALKTDADGEEKITVSGSYKFIASNGVEYTVSYTADENGFHPVGDHLPGYKGVLCWFYDSGHTYIFSAKADASGTGKHEFIGVNRGKYTVDYKIDENGVCRIIGSKGLLGLGGNALHSLVG